MEHYVTLFNNLFLPQGLTLHASLQRHAGNYTLWIICLDETTYNILEKLNLNNIRLIALSSVETEELKAVKPDRTIAEYCWTLTPFAPRFVFKEDSSVERITYLDADTWFRKSPLPIFQEFEESGKEVLITDHAYAAEYDHSATSGQYCVQFIVFTREGGERVRQWWEDRCIEWCYNRDEDGKFGDQKYLNDWPERFSQEVHVLKNKELLLAPWNAIRFPYGNSIMYHFHGLRLLKNNQILLSTGYKIPKVVVKNIHWVYADSFIQSLESLQQVGHIAQSQAKHRKKSVIKLMRRGLRSFWADQKMLDVVRKLK